MVGMTIFNLWPNACENSTVIGEQECQTTSASADRRTDGTVAAGEAHEVAYFAKKNGISKEQALELIKRFGNDRKTLDAEAAKLKRK
jgi:hypothetical protein